MLIMQQYDEFSSIRMKFIEICCIHDTKIADTPTFCHAIKQLPGAVLSRQAARRLSYFFPNITFIIVTTTCR